MTNKPRLPRRISHSTPPSTTHSRHVDRDDRPSRSHRRASVTGERRRRRRSVDSDDTYYDPRDKYYLTGSEDEAQPRDPKPSRRRGRSLNPLRRRRRSRSRSVSTASSSSSRSQSPVSDRDHHHGHSGRRHHHYSPASSRASSPPPYSPRRSKSRVRSSSPPPYSARSSHSHSSKSRGRSDSHKTYRPKSRSRSYSRSRSPSPSPRPEKYSTKPKSPTDMLLTAARTALETAALTALKMRDDPSPLLGPKGGKIAAAALSAAVVDTFIDKKHPKVRKGGMRHTVIRQATQLAIGNIVGDDGGKGSKKGGGKVKSKRRR